jgi:hypothetical protein
VVEAELVRIRWPHADRVLVARLPGPQWARLAQADCLHVRTQHPGQASVSVIADPSDEASIVLVVPRNVEPAAPVEIAFRALAQPIDRSVGAVLAPAIEHIRWLEALPAFAARLAGAARRLEDELLALRRRVGARNDLALLPELIAFAREQEDEAARRFDAAIIDEALERSKKYWNWQTEYGGRVSATPRAQPSTCPACGGLAKDSDLTDWVNPRVRRCVKVCGYCGIVNDVPAWGLRVRMDRETLIFSATDGAQRSR